MKKITCYIMSLLMIATAFCCCPAAAEEMPSEGYESNTPINLYGYVPAIGNRPFDTRYDSTGMAIADAKVAAGFRDGEELYFSVCDYLFTRFYNEKGDSSRYALPLYAPLDDTGYPNMDVVYTALHYLNKYAKDYYIADYGYTQDVFSYEEIMSYPDYFQDAGFIQKNKNLPVGIRIFVDNEMVSYFNNTVQCIIQNIPVDRYDDPEKQMEEIVSKVQAYYHYDWRYETSDLLTCVASQRGICWAYAQTICLLCNHYDVPCIFVLGDNKNDGTVYAWNRYYANGEWHDVDAGYNRFEQELAETYNERKFEYPEIILNNQSAYVPCYNVPTVTGHAGREITRLFFYTR